MSGGESWRIAPRSEALERLGSGVFDLLVVGGGIVGGRVAYDASRCGLRVALVDAGDFAGATSGASAGLVHGGLRYLKRGDLGVVRAACRERDVLASRVAPHLVRSLPFVAASAGGVLHGAVLAAGLGLYAAVGGPQWPLPRPVSRREAPTLVTHLRSGRATPLALFHEASVDDARLTLATITAAARAGAVVANHAGVRHLHVVAGGVSEAVVSGKDVRLRVRARAVVNCAGPWADNVRRMEDPRCRPLTRLSKGIHVALPDKGWEAGLAVFLEDGGHLYAVPRHGVLLLGTTDEEYAGDPGAVRATPADVSNLVEKAGAFLPGALRADAVLSSFAGLRVLPRGEGGTAGASRGHLLSVGPEGMVSVAGGKLTTHRRISLDAIRHLPAGVRPRKVRGDLTPLPGAFEGAASSVQPPRNATGRHLVGVYGAGADGVLSRYGTRTGALEPISPDGPDVWAQVHHAIEEEWAVTVEDVVRRRTTLALRGLDTPAARAGISRVLDRISCGPLASGKTA